MEEWGRERARESDGRGWGFAGFIILSYKTYIINK